MNPQNFELAKKIVQPAYIEQAQQARRQRENILTSLLAQRKLPEQGWDDNSIRMILSEFAAMDSNNFIENVGVGDREARVYSSIVSEKNYHFAHGMGRSGDLLGEQPKAAGGSLMVKLTHYMLMDVLKLSGYYSVESCLILPCATGMSVTLTMLALRQQRTAAQYVLFPRMDQKACFKSIFAAGVKPIVVNNKLDGDEVQTDVDAIESKIKELGAESILCVLSTTSCFAPRIPDRVIEIAKLCSQYDVGHIVNNAYGLQSSKCAHLITEASKLGRVDAFIQSTDKNLLVPVGGAIVAVCKSGDNNNNNNNNTKTETVSEQKKTTGKQFIKDISQLYPGRASISPLMDVFITLLSMGQNGYKKLLKERKELFQYFTTKTSEFAEAHNERLLNTPNNPISFAISLSQFSPEDVTFFGSMLFSRFVSGTRAVNCKAQKSINGYMFEGYEAHIDHYPTPYLNASCTIGIRKDEIDTFLQRLKKAWTAFTEKTNNKGKLNPQ